MRTTRERKMAVAAFWHKRTLKHIFLRNKKERGRCIMFRVKNRKAVRRIADRSFTANRTRNLIAAIAIALTSVLFTAVFTIGSGMVENFQRQTMRQAGGDGMGALKYITDEEYEKVKDHGLIEEISYNRILSDKVLNEELLKRRAELYYMDDVGIKLGFCEPEEGRKPEKENEIMMDTRAIQMLGIRREVGAPVTLRLLIHGEEVSRDFVLSGWWEADPVFQISIMVTSKAYVDAHMDELYNSYKDNYELTGVINSYIMFRNSWNLEKKMERVIVESGFSMDENAGNFINNNVNWSYISANFDMDPGMAAAMAAAAGLIVLTGYLIIYNIFQISVVRDIRFYGLLKTIGATGKQMKKIICRQALRLAGIGIPVGLLAGYLVGCGLVPVITEAVIADGGTYAAFTSANPLIFIGSGIFSLFTVAISTAKPGKIAAKVSPVEAVRYTEGGSVQSRRLRWGKKEGRNEAAVKKQKGTEADYAALPDGSRARGIKRVLFHSGISFMAAANLGRDKKRTMIVVLSMALSLVLFNTIYTFSIGFDMDKYLSKFLDSDFMVAHVSYFNYMYSGFEESVPESMINAIMEAPGIEEGGRIYSNIRDAEAFTVEPVEKGASLYQENPLSDGTDPCAVYGMEDFPLGNLEVIEGEIDIEKLKTGKYILEGINCDDDGKPYWESSHYNIGDKVILHNYKGTSDIRGENEPMTYEYEVMAKVKVGYYTNSCRVGYNYSFYLPAEVYLQMTARPGIMSYVFNVQDGMEAGMESFLQDYTGNDEPMMNYHSKAASKAEFEGLRNMILLIGGALSFIIGLIGILNFINSMLTGIITRSREFAVLQAVGMTAGQLRKMLVMEGFFYTSAAGAAALVLGAGMSFLIAGRILSALWFFTYHFTLWPLAFIIPILLTAGICIPGIMLKPMEKQSIVERIRADG